MELSCHRSQVIVEFSSRALLLPPWREVGQIYRRVCWLHSQSRDAEAQLMRETQLATAVAAARASPIAPATDAQLQAVLDQEADRVATAVALVELLTPILNASPPFAGRAPPVRAAAAVRDRPPRPSDSPTPSVADFIDDMLAQESSRRS